MTIDTTAEHPFFEESLGWIEARSLAPGHRLRTLDGSAIAVESLAETGQWQPVYNLRVADWHTYFVGCQEWGFSIWAHNLRCRHHTDDEHLRGIQQSMGINPSGTLRGPVVGVHVELPEFGPIRSKIPGRSAGEMVGAAHKGAYVEFDVPQGSSLIPHRVGPLNTAVIPTEVMLSLNGLNPVFVQSRKWWQFWKPLFND